MKKKKKKTLINKYNMMNTYYFFFFFFCIQKSLSIHMNDMFFLALPLALCVKNK